MADFAIALKARWNAFTPLITFIGTGKLHWGKVPQAVELDYVRLTVISDPRPEHLKGYTGARVSRVQADAFSMQWGRAREAAELLIAGVAEPGVFAGIHFGRVKAIGPRDLGEEVDGKGFIHRASIDLLVEHKIAD